MTACVFGGARQRLILGTRPFMKGAAESKQRWVDVNTVIQAGMAALALSGMAFGIGRLVVYFGERSIEHKHGAVGMRDRLTACAKLEAALEARRAERMADHKKIDEQIQEVSRRRRQVDRALADALSAGDTLVRIIGEEVKGTPCYYAEVNNRYVTSANFEQQAHAYIDASWAAPQVIEVWTRSISEARTEIERRYPPAFGYNISRLIDINSAEAMKPQKKA